MKNLRNERGAVFVLVGLALVMLAAIIGFATDVGVLAYTQNQGQAAVDTAALAGTSGIPEYFESGDDSLILERIGNLDDANDVRGEGAGLGESATVDLLHYDAASDSFTCDGDCDQQEVNAIRVTNSGYETPMYFSWARNLLGAGETGTKTVNVSAVAHLPCPNWLEPEEEGPAWGPIALRECKIDFPDNCQVSTIIQSSQSVDNSAFTTFNLTGSNACGDLASGNPPAGMETKIEVGDVINLVGTGSATSCLKKLDDHFEHCTTASCSGDSPDPTCEALLPVIDCGGPESNGTVKGFAKVCFTNITSPPEPKLIEVQVECPWTGGGGSGGDCNGGFSHNPVLIR